MQGGIRGYSLINGVAHLQWLLQNLAILSAQGLASLMMKPAERTEHGEAQIISFDVNSPFFEAVNLIRAAWWGAKVAC